jgi:cell division protein ZipA
MWELRWILVGLGALLVVGVYLWGRGLVRYGKRLERRRRERSEPPFAPAREELEPASAQEPAAGEDSSAQPPPSRVVPERVVAIRFIPRSQELDSERAVLALREAGLEHGRYGIFHQVADDSRGDASFSVASLTEPGSFDLDSLTETIAGMSFFMVLPGPGDPVARFDTMVSTARAMAVELDAELYDDRGSSWSIQRERYVREEIIEYRHQLERR